MTYRRLNFEEGPFESLTLLARAVSAQMLRLSDSDGCIRFFQKLDAKGLAKDVGRRLGRHQSDGRVLPRLMKEIVESGMWSWGTDSDGEIVLVPSPFVMTPPKEFASGKRKKKNAVSATLHERSTDASHTLSGRGGDASLTLSRRDDMPKSPKSINSARDNIKIKINKNINKNIINDDWDKREKPPWLRAAKIIKDLFESETQTAWHSMPKHQTELGPLWRWAEQQARITKSNPEHVLSVVVKAWLSDRWVASNGYPLSRLTKEPQSFLLVGKRKPNEKKNDKINALRAEKARLIAARDYDGAQRVADRLSALR